MQRIEIEGVPVFTAPGPRRVTAALVFGVGIRDETYATLGVTHLIEHLVMGALPKSHLDCNAMVDVEATTFYATGRPEAVASFLATVCAALSELPTDRIELETGVLQAENCHGTHPTAAVLWAARYGLAGPGLAIAGGGVPVQPDAETVRAHARRWFVRGNAALVWHGPAPARLRLPLPDGPRPERLHPDVRPQTGPLWTSGPTTGVGLLLTSTEPANSALNVAFDVLQERMRDVARHQRGLSYATAAEVLDATPGERVVAILADARGGQEAAVAGVLWEQYRELCERGPTPTELAHAVEGFEEQLDSGDDTVLAELSRAAFCEVFARPYRASDRILAEWRQVTPEAAATSLRATLSGAVLALPGGVRPSELPALPEFRYLCTVVPALPTGGTVFRPSLLARARSRDARISLVVTDELLVHQDADGDVHIIDWADVVAAHEASDGKGLLVVGRGLCRLDVHEEVYGRRAVEAVRARVPQGLHIPAARPARAEATDLVPAAT